jgi:hypothetical protein
MLMNARPSGRRARPGAAVVRRWPVALAAVVLSATFAAGSSAAAAPEATRSPGDPTVISRWNQLATTVLAADTTKAQPGNIFLMGILHAGIYDAVVGVEGRFEPYKYRPRASRGTSAQAAAVASAHQILVTYVPTAKATLDAAYTADLAQIPDSQAKDKGVAYGTKVADNLIRLRADDGRNADIKFTQEPAPGVWRPTPPGSTDMLDPWLAFVTPLLVRSATQFAPPPPPALTSAEYTKDLNEVKAIGSKTSTVRTPEQTSTAMFYSGSLLFQWNAMLRDQAAVRKLDIVDSARMFAAVDMSIADAYLTVWRAKYVHGFWRPITAISLADTDGNPDTVADPTWEPVIATPAYPEWSSGYNAMTATATGGIEKLFGKVSTFTLASSAVPDVRRYNSGKDIRADVLEARILLGIHYRSADAVSRDLGLRLVDWTLARNFRPVRSGRY